ncbi:MAG: di-trans,poly-cis-decaprenylcistransferase [Deltaproteobacteria bacterium]|nr:di-trans,poly-cis-decaprenylcistransferase [Deltaproteobacteria bacterium]
MPEMNSHVPQHVAIIMDGNGRWARERGLPRREGHRAGAESVREVVETCKELGIKFLTLYAFSSENWNRPKTEIKALMSLLKGFLRRKTPEMQRQGVRLHAIGRLEELPDDCRAELEQAIAHTSSNTDLDLVLALSYGAREEIVDACRQLAREAATGDLDPESIDTNAITVRPT